MLIMRSFFLTVLDRVQTRILGKYVLVRRIVNFSPTHIIHTQLRAIRPSTNQSKLLLVLSVRPDHWQSLIDLILLLLFCHNNDLAPRVIVVVFEAR